MNQIGVCCLYTAQLFVCRYKNRLQLSPDATCVGVDMNRCVCRILSNSEKVVHPMVGIGWGCVLQAEYVLGSNTEVQGYKWKASSDNLLMNLSTSSPAGSCSHWYPGNRPFQAPEVNNMENYFSRLPRLKAFLDLRSYGQMCMFNPPSMTDSSLMPFFQCPRRSLIHAREARKMPRIS